MNLQMGMFGFHSRGTMTSLFKRLRSGRKKTRDPANLGRRRAGTGKGTAQSTFTADGANEADVQGEEKSITKLFEEGKWDTGKMVRSFARVGALNKRDVATSHEGVSCPCCCPLFSSLFNSSSAAQRLI